MASAQKKREIAAQKNENEAEVLETTKVRVYFPDYDVTITASSREEAEKILAKRMTPNE